MLGEASSGGGANVWAAIAAAVTANVIMALFAYMAWREGLSGGAVKEIRKKE